MSEPAAPPKPRAAPSWLSPTRLHRQALLLTIALWLGYVLNMSAPGMRDRFGHLKGADFLHSYILGTLALNHLGNALYDPRIQRDMGDARVPGSAGDYFLPVYPPHYSLFWMPFAKLPYPWAAAMWIALSALIYAACCYAIWRSCPHLRSDGVTVALLAAAFPGFYELINFGQNSSLALACFTGMYFALRARRDFLAGLCLGLLAFKPQLALVSACVILFDCFWPRSMALDRLHHEAARLQKAWKILLGAILTLAAQIGAVWLWYGSGPLLIYAHLLPHLASAARILEPKPYLMHSLRAFWDLLLPWPHVALALYIPTAVAATVLTIVCWHPSIPLEHRFSILLLATVLVAPHLTVYDLVILAPAFLWIAEACIAKICIAKTSVADSVQPGAGSTPAIPTIAWLLYLSYILPFAGPLSQWTHLQLSVICLSALLVIFSEKVRREVEV